MITEYPVVLIGFSLQGGEINFFRGELVQASPHQVRMAPQKIPELLKLLFIFQWVTISVVQFSDLIDIKIFQSQACPHVEG